MHVNIFEFTTAIHLPLSQVSSKMEVSQICVGIEDKLILLNIWSILHLGTPLKNVMMTM